jgi:hypothetical protein
MSLATSLRNIIAINVFPAGLGSAPGNKPSPHFSVLSTDDPVIGTERTYTTTFIDRMTGLGKLPLRNDDKNTRERQDPGRKYLSSWYFEI